MASRVRKRGTEPGPSIWRSLPFGISEETELALLGHAGIQNAASTEARHLLGAAGLLLGQYRGAVQALDNAPRAVEYVRAARAISSHCDALAKLLQSLPPHVRDQVQAELFAVPSAELPAIENAIARLRAAAATMAGIYAREPSRGRRPMRALALTVARLRELFQAHYAGPRDPPRQRGAFKYRSEMQERERRFVLCALDAIGIHSADLDRLMRRERSPRQK